MCLAKITAVPVFIATSLLSTPVLSDIDVDFTTPAPLYELSGAGPDDLVAGDVNNDGSVDIIVSSFGFANSNVSVLLNDGSGDLSDNKGFSLLNGPHGLTLQQMDNDSGGNLDVVVAVQDYFNGNLDGRGPGSGIDIFYGDGAGSFGVDGGLVNSPNVHIDLLEPTDVASADFDGDGINDLAVSRELGGVAVYLGQIDGGTGVLSFTGPVAVGSGGATDILVDDFDGDENWDIATPNAVYFGDGTGGFSDGTVIGGDWAVASGDINGDAYSDIAVLSGTTFGTSLHIKLGNADRSFTDIQTYTDSGTNIDFNDVYIADLNLDGYGDVVLSDGRSHVVRVFVQSCDGLLQAPISIATPLNTPVPVYAGTLNNSDAHPDIITALHNGGETPYAAVFLQTVPVPAAGTMSFCRASYNVSEPDAGFTTQATVVVTRTGGTQGTVSATYSSTGGSATAGSDYSAISGGTVTMADGISRAMFDIDVLGDDVYDPGEEITLALSGTAVVPNPDNANIIILDNDPAPVITLATNNYNVDENAGQVVLTVNRTNASENAVTVDYATANGTAVAGASATTPGADFVTSSGTLTFLPDDTAHTIIVPIVDETDYEADETFTLNLSAFSGGAVAGAFSSATVNIVNDDAQPAGTLQFNNAGFTVSENETVTVYVTRTGGSNGVVSAMYETIDGTAVSNGSTPDFIATSGSVIFADGVSVQPIVISLIDDAVAENSESFTLALTGATGGAQLGSVIESTLSISDNDTAGVTVGAVSGSTSEAGGVASFTVALDSQPIDTVTIPISSEDPGEGTVSAANLIFTAENWSTLQSVVVTGVNDTDVDGDVVYTVKVGEPSSVADEKYNALTDLDTADVSLTNIDDDTVSVAFQLPSSSTVDESSGAHAISVIMKVSSGGSITNPVNVDVIDAGTGSANSTLDYNTFGTQTVTFASGSNHNATQTVVIDVLDDSLYEGNESVNLQLVNPSGAGLVAPSTHVVTLTDDDPADKLQFNPSSYTFDEAAGTVSIVVARTGTINVGSLTATVSAGLAGDTAGDGDYLLNDATVTIGDGLASSTVSMSLVDDASYEGLEFFTVNLNGADVAASNTAARINITDNDPAASFQFEFDTYRVDENTTSGEIILSVTRTGDLESNFTVNYVTGSLSDVAQGGSVDYSSASGLLNFNPQQLTQTITIPIVDDNLYEGDESFTVALNNPSGTAVLGSPALTTVIITDNETPPPAGSLKFEQMSYSVNENVTQIELLVNRVNGSSGNISVDYVTASDSATDGADFSGTSGTLVFDDGDTTPQLISIPILDDSVYEGDELFSVSLNNPQADDPGAASYPTLDSPAVATVTIVENDTAPPAGSMQFEYADYTIGESQALVEVRVTRSNGTAGSIEVDYVSGGGNATVGSDYTGVSGSVFFPDGDNTPKPISVVILDDTRYEGDEYFNLTLLNPRNTQAASQNTPPSLGNITTTTTTITDDELPPQYGSFIIDPSMYNVSEDGGSIDLNVQRIGGSDGTVTVEYATGHVDDTALPGEDYVAIIPATSNLTFVTGETSHLINVDILDDMLYEGPEHFTVYLSNPAGGAQLGSQFEARVSLRDNDPIPADGALQFEYPSSSEKYYIVAEQQNSVELTVIRVGGTGNQASIDFRTEDGNARAGEDYEAQSGQLIFSPGMTSQSIVVGIIDNDVYVGQRSFYVNLSNPVGTDLGSENRALVNIIEDETEAPAPRGKSGRGAVYLEVILLLLIGLKVRARRNRRNSRYYVAL